MSQNSILETTVVGSYPPTINRKEVMGNYYNNIDPYLFSIEEAVKDQIEAGIDIISDGQTRKDMIDLFADGLLGIRIKERSEIISEIKWKEPITVDDQEYINNFLHPDVKIKGIITGPWTLYKNSVDKHYKSEKDAVMDISKALSKEVMLLSNICDYIQIDEPFLSVEFPDFTDDAIKTVIDKIKVPSILHVCGDITNISDKIVELSIDILDHEFAEHPSLYEEFEDLDFSQRVSVGVATTQPTLEKVDKIYDRIERAYETFGKYCMIDPDCGLRNLERNTAKKKLENMVKARDLFIDNVT